MKFIQIISKIQSYRFCGQKRVLYIVSQLAALVMLILLTNGCTSEFNLATQQEESLMYGTDKEVAIGESVAQSIEKQFKQVMDVDINTRVERIFDSLIEVSDRKDIVYFVKVLDEEHLNAISLPGGYMYVFKGLVDHVENDDQLAGVIAHELGHITARHGVKRIQASYAALLLQVASIEAGGRTAAGVNAAINSLFMEYSQQDEFEADRLSVKYMKLAGYDPNEMSKFLKILKKESDKKGLNRFSYWRTHPHIPQRIAIVNQEINGKMGFRDYINLTGTNAPKF